MSKTFVVHRKRDIHAIRDLSFEVKDKELLVLAGPSGCGKTTTLRLIAGLEQPTTGTVSIDGKVVNDLPAKDRNVAMVFQDLALYPHMTARENMVFGLQARKHSKEEIASRIGQAVEMLGLTDCIQRKPSEMSGGQRQRVALGRALVLRPNVLLLDEPLSDLDAPLRARMRVELSALQQRLGITMIYVTHDQIDAMTLGHRLAIMKEGALQQIGDPKTIYRKPANAFVAGFIGSPLMNFFKGRIVQIGEKLLFREELCGDRPNVADGHAPRLEFELPPAKAPTLQACIGEAVMMGLRPEHMILGKSGACTSEAVLEKVECLGPEIHIHCKTAAHSFVARQIPGRLGIPNETGSVFFTFDLQAAHFFDAGTGIALD